MFDSKQFHVSNLFCVYPVSDVLFFSEDLTPVWIGIGVGVFVLLGIVAVVSAAIAVFCMKR